MRRIIVFLVTIILILTGCSKDNSNTDIQGSSLEPLELSKSKLGKINFEPDSSKEISKEFSADGSELSISVTDVNGMIWTLTIPKDALLEKEEIIMIPMVNIERDTFPGAPTSGIILEPDGLQFLSSATLSVKKDDEVINGLILNGNFRGSELEFSPTSIKEDGVEAPITHFSTYIFTTLKDENMKEIIEEIAEEQYREAAKVANELLKQPIEIIAPPDIKLECYSSDKTEAAKAYAKKILQPENSVINRLLGSSRLSSNPSDEAFELAAKLAERNVKKVHKLIKTYQPQPEKLIPVFYAAGSVAKESALLSIKDIPEPADFYNWADKVQEHCFDELKNKHNYKYINSIYMISYLSYIAGVDSGDIIQKLDDLLTFKLEYSTTFKSEDLIVKLKGEGTFKYRGKDEEGGCFFEGEAISKNIEKTDSSPNASGKEEIRPKTFPIKIYVNNFDPCKNQTVDILLEKIEPENETHVSIDEDGKEYSLEVPAIETFARLVFEREYEGTENGGYVFTLPLRNNQQIAVDGTVVGVDEEGDFTFHQYLKLTHTP